MTYGAIDIGTNSCRLLIAEICTAGRLNTITRVLETTRIGEGVNHNLEISREAMERTVDCLRRFAGLMQTNQVESWRAVATSAVREAINRLEFVDLVREQTGMPLDVLNGGEEAKLSYIGAVRGLHMDRPPLVVDLGGGSTEFVCPDLRLHLSIPLGAVRATETDMSRDQMLQQLQILRGWAQSSEQSLAGHRLVFVGGTATSLVAIKKGIPEYRTELVHGETLNRGEVFDLYDLLEALPLDLRRRLPGLQPERADIINKGTLIVLAIMEVLAAKEIIISESDILDGIIWGLTGQ